MAGSKQAMFGPRPGSKIWKLMIKRDADNATRLKNLALAREAKAKKEIERQDEANQIKEEDSTAILETNKEK